MVSIYQDGKAGYDRVLENAIIVEGRWNPNRCSEYIPVLIDEFVGAVDEPGFVLFHAGHLRRKLVRKGQVQDLLGILAAGVSPERPVSRPTAAS